MIDRKSVKLGTLTFLAPWRENNNFYDVIHDLALMKNHSEDDIRIFLTAKELVIRKTPIWKTPTNQGLPGEFPPPRKIPPTKFPPGMHAFFIRNTFFQLSLSVI